MSKNEMYRKITKKTKKYGNVSRYMIMLPYNINTYHKLVNWYMVINKNMASSHIA